MTDKFSSGHSVSVDTHCIAHHGDSMDFILSVDICGGLDTSTFRFLINHGSSFYLDRDPPHNDGIQTLIYMLDTNAIDAILLCGASISEVGSLVPLMLKYPQIPVICTDGTLKFAKVHLYDRVINIQTMDYITTGFSPDNISPQNRVSSSITLDDVDQALSRVQRVRYYEQLTFPYPNDHETEPTSRRCRLTVQAVPSGQFLGSSAWYFTSDGEYASVLAGTVLTMKKNWFFDGFNPNVCSKPPSVIVLKGYRNPALRADGIQEALSARSFECRTDSLKVQGTGCRPNHATAERAGTKVIDTVRRTLARGGSVLIPTDLGLDALKLLILFQFSWTPSWSAYPIYFISPTGDMMVSFARTMLDWMSPKFRNSFCETRKNPFDCFTSIKFVTSLTAALESSDMPSVFISTPSQIHLGGFFTLNIWLHICTNPLSAVVFLRSPCKEDLDLIQQSTVLFFKRIDVSNMEKDVITDSTREDVPFLQVKHSVKDETLVSNSRESSRDDTAITENTLLQTSPPSDTKSSFIAPQPPLADDYGTLLTAEQDDWADLCMPTCVHDATKGCSNEIIAASDSALPDNGVTSSEPLGSRSTIAEAQNTTIPTRLTRILAWTTTLRTLAHQKEHLWDRTHVLPATVRASHMTILGLFDDEVVCEASDGQSFMDWLLPVIFLKPQHLVVLSLNLQLAVFEVLFNAALRLYLNPLPRLYYCTPEHTRSGKSTDSSQKRDTHDIGSNQCKVVVSWNELSVDLRDPFFIHFLKDHHNRIHGHLKSGSPDTFCAPFFPTLDNTTSSRFRRSRFSNGSTTLTYIPLLLECDNKDVESLPSAQDTSQDGVKSLQSVADVKVASFMRFLTPKKLADKPAPTSDFNDTLESSVCTTDCKLPLNTLGMAKCGWINVGPLTQSTVLDVLKNEFQADLVTTCKNVIIIGHKAYITFSSEGNNEIVSVSGGIDLTTIWLKQRLQQLLQGTGTLFRTV